VAGPRRALCLLVALAAVLAAGCGGESRLTKAQYEQRVRSVYAGVQQAFLATNVESLTLLARRVAAAQAALRHAAARLDADRPPKEIESPNDELVEGMRRYADQLGPLQAAAARGDLAAVERLKSTYGRSDAIERPREAESESNPIEQPREAESESDPIEQMAEAVEEMTREGFDLGRIAKE
jgi:hypothetical protein